MLLIVGVFCTFIGLVPWSIDMTRKKRLISFISLAIGISCLGVDWYIMSSYYEETVVSEVYKLVSIQDASEIYGEGRGSLTNIYVSIETRDVYTFYYQVEGNGFKRGKIAADDAVVFERDDCIPHIVEQTTYRKNRIKDTCSDWWWDLLGGFEPISSTSKYYEIYVPKGSIIRDFTFDLQ